MLSTLFASRVSVTLSCDQIHQRELEDSLKLRERQVEIEAINEQIKAEEQRLDGLDVNNLTKEQDSLEKEKDKLLTEVFCAHLLNNSDDGDSDSKWLHGPHCCQA